MTCKIKGEHSDIDSVGNATATPRCVKKQEKEQKDGRLLVLLALAAFILLLPRLGGLFAPNPVEYQYVCVRESGADVDGVYRAPASQPLARFLQDGLLPGPRVGNDSLPAPAIMPGQPLISITIDKAGLISATEPDPQLFFFFNLPVPINRAEAATLERIPGIGPVLAHRIITFREKYAITGPERLRDIPGIGPSLTKKLTPYLTFE